MLQCILYCIVQASKVSKPEEFLINLKKNLSEESYSNFKKSFAEYKKVFELTMAESIIVNKSSNCL